MKLKQESCRLTCWRAVRPNQHYCFFTIGVDRHALASQLSTDFQCIAYDQRGWGESDVPEQGYSIGELALDARHIIEALHVRRYVLVGHSMGGKIAQFLAAKRLPGLAGLVLVAPATPTLQNIPEPARQAQLHAYDSRENALEAMAFLTAHPPSDTLGEQILADNFAARSPEAKLAWPTSLAYEDIREKWEALRCRP